MPLVILLPIMILAFTLKSLLTRFYNDNYAAPDASMATPVFTICYGAFCGLTTLALNGFVYQPQWQTVVFGLCNSLMLVLYNASLLEGGKRGPYAFLMICMMFGGILLPLLVEVLFMGAAFTTLQGIAIVIMLGSFVVMNARGLSFKGTGRTYYFWCAVLTFANGMSATILDLQARLMGPGQNGEVVVTGYLGLATLVTLSYVVRGRGRQLAQGMRMGKKAGVFALIIAATATAAANLVMVALAQMDASLLYTIYDGGILVMSAILSCVMLHERMRWEQIIGVGMAVVSIAMLCQ